MEVVSDVWAWTDPGSEGGRGKYEVEWGHLRTRVVRVRAESRLACDKGDRSEIQSVNKHKIKIT